MKQDRTIRDVEPKWRKEFISRFVEIEDYNGCGDGGMWFEADFEEVLDWIEDNFDYKEKPQTFGDGHYCTHHPDDPNHGSHCYEVTEDILKQPEKQEIEIADEIDIYTSDFEDVQENRKLIIELQKAVNKLLEK